MSAVNRSGTDRVVSGSILACKSLTPASATNYNQNPNGSLFSGQHIAELKPRILFVHEGREVTKYFISSGVVFIHANPFADTIAVQAIPVDHIDPCLVQKGLAEFTEKLSSASTDFKKAEAQIGVDHSALNSTITG
ncbi:hypothetical protein MRB53_006575 [Persea americana]|uniref:Uncharacterized protein n=1 Tax=Persea americana TaxID=3435 RepID=A0ACC2MGJ6_PERAE|nr:hypothetical protein MRB53_006575 [Persea americana]